MHDDTCTIQVGRIKQKRGYKDQWPWNIKIYTDETGNNKGDACLAFEDPSAAHSAGGFFNGTYHLPYLACSYHVFRVYFMELGLQITR